MYMNTVLEFKNVNYSYKDAGKELIILDSVDFNFESGKFYTILGASGSGKQLLYHWQAHWIVLKVVKSYMKVRILRKLV